MRTIQSELTWPRSILRNWYELKALFEDQAQSHNLYPYITWDDVLNGRIHRAKGSNKSFFDAVKDLTKGGDSQ